MENAQDFVVDPVMSKHVSCSKDFPDECEGCPDYVESFANTTVDTALTGWFGLYSGPGYLVKKCTRFNRKSYVRI